MAFNSDNSAQMPSGGTRAPVPDLKGVAPPSKVRARVRAERDADRLGGRVTGRAGRKRLTRPVVATMKISSPCRAWLPSIA